MLLTTSGALAAECPKGAECIIGIFAPVDGDSGALDGVEIRLEGLAAPEWNKPGGQEATKAMRDMAAGQTLTCEIRDTDRYGRKVVLCRLPDGRDIAELLVRMGRARDCPRFSGGRYADAEQAAADDGAPIRDVYDPLPGYCERR